MTEPTPDRLRTVDVDAEIQRFLPPIRLPSPLVGFGLLTAFVGLLLRLLARRLAWPERWEYSGDRANTDWAFNEALYIDLGLVLLVFGLALLFVAIVRATRTPDPT